MPLIPAEQVPMPISELNPVFEIKGKRYVMITQAIGSVSGSDLKCAVMFLDGHSALSSVRWTVFWKNDVQWNGHYI